MVLTSKLEIQKLESKIPKKSIIDIELDDLNLLKTKYKDLHLWIAYAIFKKFY